VYAEIRILVAIIYARAMTTNPLVVEYVIAEDPANFPARHLLPEGMKTSAEFRFGPTQVWQLQREIPNETIDASPDAVIRAEFDRFKESHKEFFAYLGKMQHWWPVLHSTIPSSRQDRVDVYTDKPDVYVDWDYLLIRRSNSTQVEELVKISAQMVARCYGLTEAIRSCQSIMSDIPSAGDVAELRASVDALETVKYALWVDLVTSDARPSVYESYAFEAYSEIRRVWNIDEIEVSSQRCLDACESMLGKVRQASQARGDRLRADTLLFLTVISSVSAIFSFLGYIDSSETAFDIVRIGVSAAIALGAGTIFWALRRFSSD